MTSAADRGPIATGFLRSEWHRHSRSRRGQHQRVPELHDLLDAIGIDDLEARQGPCPVIHVEFAWSGDQMIQPVESHLDDVVIGIVGEPSNGSHSACAWSPSLSEATSISASLAGSTFETRSRNGRHSAFSSLWMVIAKPPLLETSFA